MPLTQNQFINAQKYIKWSIVDISILKYQVSLFLAKNSYFYNQPSRWA